MKLAREKSSDNRLNVDTVLHRLLCDNIEILEPDFADNCENKGGSFYIDLIIAVEWNSDIPYFGTVVESLVRDLHCYCVQANSSDYGDSRLLQPTQTEIRDAIKTKGGKNPCILFDEIDIKALRDFQAKSVDLQKMDGPFKQTPPGLNRSILAKKRAGTLQEDIEK